MRLVAEAGLVSNLANGTGIVCQQPGREVKAQLPDQLAGGPVQQHVELSVELGNAEVHLFGQAFDTEVLFAKVPEDAGLQLFQKNMIAGNWFRKLLRGGEKARYIGGRRVGGFHDL